MQASAKQSIEFLKITRSFLAGSVAATTAFGTTMGITLIGIDFLSKGKFLPAIVREFSKHNS